MSIYGGPDIITDGLIWHLDAANRKSYPGSGSTWYDLSGNNYHHTIYNSPAWDGKTLDFATDEYGQHISGTFYYGDNYTIISFNDMKDVPSSWRTLIRGNSEHPLLISTANKLGWYSNVGGGFRDCGYNVETGGIENRFNMIALIGEGGATNKFYVDGGNQVGSSTTNTLGNNCSPYYQYRICWPGQPWGKIGTLLGYNRALSMSELDKNYEALKGRYGL